MLLEGIKAILFDFGGVLVNLDKQACLDAFAAKGITNVSEHISNYSQSGLFLKLERGEISADEFRNELRSSNQLDLSDEEIDAAWNAFLLDIPQYKLDLLYQLRERFRILMLSNTNVIHFEQKAMSEFSKAGKELNDYFHTCYLSYEIGMVKPNEDIFHHILAAENFAPHEILFLDDGVKNIEVAKALGFKTYLVKEREDFSSIFNS